MGEWDGLEARLKDLGDEAARLVDDPLDAARVRRLADRRRLRRSVAAVLIAVVILVSGGVGVYAVTSQPEPYTPSPVGDPTSTPTPSPEPSEEISARGERIPSATSEPGGRQPVPPTYRSSSPYSPDPTPESPTPSQTSSPSPSETSEEPEPGADVHLDGGSGCAPDLGTDQRGAVAGRRRPPRRRATRPPAADARTPRRRAADALRPVAGSSIGSVSSSR